MNQKTRNQIIRKANSCLHQGFHCSEGILLAAGEFYFPERLPELLKTAAPFSGGVAGTKEEMCGAFSGGLIVLGMLFGRTHPEMDDDMCLTLSAAYRCDFMTHFGYLRCKDLRENWVGKPGQPDCAALTAQATALLLDVIEK